MKFNADAETTNSDKTHNCDVKISEEINVKLKTLYTVHVIQLRTG